MFWRKNKNSRRDIRVIQLSTLRSEGNQMGIFNNRRQREAEAAAQRTSFEQQVIQHVSVMPDEEYRKLLKKFTAYRELQRKLEAIEDGDINDALSEASDFIDEAPQPTTPQPKKIEVQDGSEPAREDNVSEASK